MQLNLVHALQTSNLIIEDRLHDEYKCFLLHNVTLCFYATPQYGLLLNISSQLTRWFKYALAGGCDSFKGFVVPLENTRGPSS
jgi:hypothetical protein